MKYLNHRDKWVELPTGEGEPTEGKGGTTNNGMVTFEALTKSRGIDWSEEMANRTAVQTHVMDQAAKLKASAMSKRFTNHIIHSICASVGIPAEYVIGPGHNWREVRVTGEAVTVNPIGKTVVTINQQAPKAIT